MKINWVNQEPPKVKVNEGETFYLSAKKEMNSEALEETLIGQAKEIKKQFWNLGIERSYVQQTVFYVPNLREFFSKMSVIDEGYRMSMNGKLGEVGVIESDDTHVEVIAVRLPHSNSIVYDGYTSEELFNEYHTFFTAPNALEIAATWANDKMLPKLKKQTVQYGNDAVREVMDIYVPQTKKLKPLLFHVHGGYWQYSERDMYTNVANNYGSEEIVVANIDYPQAPDVTQDEMIISVKKALRYMYLNAEDLGIDKSKIYIAGHSAGSHLAASVAVADMSLFDEQLPQSFIQHAFLFSGPYNLTPFMHTVQNKVLKLNESILKRASIVEMNPTRGTSFTLFVGSKESDVYRKQSEDFKTYLEKNRIAVDIEIGEQKDHFSMVNEFYSKGTSIFEKSVDIMK